MVAQEPYWEVYLQSQPQGTDEQIRLKYFSPERESRDAERLASEMEAEKIRDALHPECTIQQITHKRKIEKPPKLFDLTSLQRYGSAQRLQTKPTYFLERPTSAMDSRPNARSGHFKACTKTTNLFPIHGPTHVTSRRTSSRASPHFSSSSCLPLNFLAVSA